MSGTRHQITMWSPLIHHVFTNLCVQEALFPAFLQQFFFPFFYNFLPKPGLLTDFRSSLSLKWETKLKGWSLNAEEVRCQLPPTLRDQIRFLTGTCLLPILPYLLLPGIQWYQQPITAQIPSTCAVGSGSSLDTFVFNCQEPWFNSTELC